MTITRPRSAGPWGPWSSTASPAATSPATSRSPAGSGPRVLEILPDWPASPTPAPSEPALDARPRDPQRARVLGGPERSGRAGSTSPASTPRPAQDSLDDLGRCVDWLAEAGGSFLVVHPGGLSDAGRRPRAGRGPGPGAGRPGRSRRRGRPHDLRREHAAGRPPREPDGRPLRAGRRDRPARDPRSRWTPGTPGSPKGSTRRPSPPAGSWPPPTSTTTTAGSDAHLPPGLGTIDWDAWLVGLDADRLPRADHAGVHQASPVGPRQPG